MTLFPPHLFFIALVTFIFTCAVRLVCAGDTGGLLAPPLLRDEILNKKVLAQTKVFPYEAPESRWLLPAEKIFSGNLPYSPQKNKTAAIILMPPLTPVISPSLPQQKIMLTTLGQDDDTRSRTPAPSTMANPTPTPVPVRTERKQWEEDVATTEADSLTIRPGSSGQCESSQGILADFTCTPKTVPAETTGNVESAPAQESHSSATTSGSNGDASAPVPEVSPQPSLKTYEIVLLKDREIWDIETTKAGVKPADYDKLHVRDMFLVSSPNRIFVRNIKEPGEIKDTDPTKSIPWLTRSVIEKHCLVVIPVDNDEDFERLKSEHQSMAVSSSDVHYLEQLINGQLPDNNPLKPVPGSSHIRNILRKRGIFFVPSRLWMDEAVKKIQEAGGTLGIDPVAGNGWLAYFLKMYGLPVISVDDGSWGLDAGLQPEGITIERNDAVTGIIHHQEADFLILSGVPLPEHERDLLYEILQAWQGRGPILYVGPNLSTCRSSYQYVCSISHLWQLYEFEVINDYQSLEENGWENVVVLYPREPGEVKNVIKPYRRKRPRTTGHGIKPDTDDSPVTQKYFCWPDSLPTPLIQQSGALNTTN